jgi:hypothetical protein
MFYVHEVRNVARRQFSNAGAAGWVRKFPAMVIWRKWQFTSLCPLCLWKQTPIGRVVYRAPRRPGSFATVIGGVASANLTPAPGCRDHTFSPSASTPFVIGASAPAASGPAAVGDLPDGPKRDVRFPRQRTLMRETVTSALRRYCCKSRKSNNPKNLAKVDLWTSLPSVAFQRHYGGP